VAVDKVDDVTPETLKAGIEQVVFAGDADLNDPESSPNATAEQVHSNGQHPPGGDPYATLIQTGKAWRSSAKESRPAIIKGVLAAESLAMLGGEPKIGKTWLSSDLILSVSSGQRFMGHYPVEQPGSVLYIGTEGSRKNLDERLCALALHKGLDPWEDTCDLSMIWREPLAMLDDPQFLEWMSSHAPNYRLIVVDVLADAWSGDENSNTEVRKLLHGIIPLTKGGPTIMLAHHFGKASKDTEGRRIGQRLRGASAFHAASDSSFFLEAPKGAVRTVVTLESRNDAPEAPFSFTWPRDRTTWPRDRTVDGTFAVDLDWRGVGDDSVATDSMNDEVLALINEQPGRTRTETAALTGNRKAAATSAINFALKQNYIHERQVQGTNARGQTRNHIGLFPGPDPHKPTLTVLYPDPDI